MDTIFAAFLFYLFGAIVTLVVLFYLIRAAVLSGLEADRVRLSKRRATYVPKS